MCGIVGATSGRDVIPLLMDGLSRLEYRGYDSAGLAVAGDQGLEWVRRAGTVECLKRRLAKCPLRGTAGIAHTRWATHGRPSEVNAHPQVSGGRIAVVHNGIVENHEQLHREVETSGYSFQSETDSEVIAHLVHHYHHLFGDIVQAVQQTVKRVEGSYAFAVLSADHPDMIVVARSGCPVVLGLGAGENFVASDVMALLPFTRRLVFLEDGDIGVIRQHSVQIMDESGQSVDRAVTKSQLTTEAQELRGYRHFMEKEIHEQARAIEDTLKNRVTAGRVADDVLGMDAGRLLSELNAVHIVACGTSFHAGLIARDQIEALCGLPCAVEIASEFRYRNCVVPDKTLFIAISQSGETADTLAAMREARKRGYLSTLCVCNVSESSLVRESDLALITHAGPEIGVASTKAFTTQLVALFLISLIIGRFHGLDPRVENQLVSQIVDLPALVAKVLEMDGEIESLAKRFMNDKHALFLARGSLNPVAMEGALKLKEISYIHAEAYPAGELKHGPLALVDDGMPVVAVVASGYLSAKLKANLEEVRARDGKLYVFTEPGLHFEQHPNVHVTRIPVSPTPLQAPILFTLPLQLLAYHVAVLRGTNVDKPRNLAKSVTVE
jgi:glutamine---fructose-6-phosphate transaminase (isomerizing)